MKKELRRIEETLQQLSNKTSDKTSALSSAGPSADSPQSDSPQIDSPQSASPTRQPLSFDLHPKVPKVASARPPIVNFTPTVSPKVDPKRLPSATFKSADPNALNLPKFKAPSLSHHRHAVNPALASNLLKEIQTIVDRWQVELSQIAHQIQELYLEGPIVDGWLESQSETSEVEAPFLRHIEIEQLVNYVEELCATPDPAVADVTPPRSYRLCGLNADGQLWSRPCPAEQVPNVSLAIARYQKLRQLLGRKQHLEYRLSQLSEGLIVMHGQMKDEAVGSREEAIGSRQ